MSAKYVLDEHGKPRPESDLMIWAKWFEEDERRIVRQQGWNRPDGVEIRVSTVFLGLDHRHFGIGRPVLWETMVFVDGESTDQYRYTSRAAAIRGHNRVVKVEGGEVLE